MNLNLKFSISNWNLGRFNLGKGVSIKGISMTINNLNSENSMRSLNLIVLSFRGLLGVWSMYAKDRLMSRRF